MRARIYATRDARSRIILLTVVSVLVAAALGTPANGRAIQGTDGEAEGARVRIVHGIADAGPLDIYVDGSLALIGILFGETSSNVVLRAGEHAFAVVPSGETPDSAIADGTVALAGGTTAYAALLGTPDSASVGLFEVDDRPLDQGRARFRIISGVPDAGEISPTFTGGDALSQPLGFGDASQYASIDAGTYDLDFLEAESGVPLLTLPQTPFAEGTTTDVVLVGQVAAGTMTALVQSIQVELTRPAGRSAQIFTGSCNNLEAAAADLGIVQPGQGAAVGSAGPAAVAQVFGSAGIPFSDLVASPYAVVISDDIELGGDVVACGDVGGSLTDTGALAIALQIEETGEIAGVAVLAPALEDPTVTGVSVFVIESAIAGGAVATPILSD